MGARAISVRFYQQSLSIHRLREKGLPGPHNYRQFTSSKWRSMEEESSEGKNSRSREGAERAGCGRTRERQEKAEASKVCRYKINHACCSLMCFLYQSTSSLLLIGAFQREAV